MHYLYCSLGSSVIVCICIYIYRERERYGDILLCLLLICLGWFCLPRDGFALLDGFHVQVQTRRDGVVLFNR